MLKSQIIGLVKELCAAITDATVASTDDAKAIVSAIYNKDSLSIITDDYKDISDLLSLKCEASEKFVYH